jgi:3-hydroxyacyl-[acyl-carrier-protein] dehydratase
VNTSATTAALSSETLPAELTLGSGAARTEPVQAAIPSDEASLREALKRCSPSTLEAALAFRATGNFVHLPAIVTGVIERFVERELRAKLATGDDSLRLVDDLALDSLTMMEIVILTEDVLPVTINNDELRHLRTLGHVKQFIECKLRGQPLPAALLAQTCAGCAASALVPPNAPASSLTTAPSTAPASSS